ncbi:MAG: HAD family hydrolase [Bacillota bacterium]
MRAALFDFDGTVADTKKSIYESLRFTALHCLGRELEPEDVKDLYGLPLSDTMQRLCPERWQELVKTYLEHNLSTFPFYATLFPGITDTLSTLKAQGLLLGLVTNKRRESTGMALALFGIEDFFDAVVCAEDVLHHKPHPEAIKLALNRLGCKPQEAVIVGDSPYDVLAGRSAGVTTIAALWGQFEPGKVLAAGPDFACNSVRELRQLLEMLCSRDLKQ